MNLFREMDLYKVIILVSLLLLPASLGFVYWVDGEIDVAQRALQAAERRGGEIERIGGVQRQLETVEKNASKDRAAGGSHAVYFEQQIKTSSKDSLSANDFEISPQSRSGVPGKSAQDMIVKISFRREGKTLDLPRDFIHAMTYNCEAGGAQIWKLRRLTMRNTDIAKVSRARQAPPRTVADEWEIQTLEFARREPDTRRR